MHPKPVGWITADRRFETGVDIASDIFYRASHSVAMRRYGLANLDPPTPQTRAITNWSKKSAMISHRHQCRGTRRKTRMSEKWQLHSLASGALVRKQNQR